MILGIYTIRVVVFFIVNNLLLDVVADDLPTKEEKKYFDALVKAVTSESGGYVHPSIGIMNPAPSSGARGLGMVKDVKKQRKDGILIQVPYSYQMTRQMALSNLTPLIPAMVLKELPLLELDDAALLVLLLAHEYGLGKKSKFRAFIDSLPKNRGGCGWASVDDFRTIPSAIDVEDIEVAMNYAHRVSSGMANDYAQYLAQSSWPNDWKENPAQALLWALCTVNSRGTQGNTYPGQDEAGVGVRLVPLADLVNHQVVSGGYVELSGKEQLANGGFIDAKETDAGAFVVRSLWRDGTKKELVKGDEITVNYNLPGYTAVDWYLSLGFVPPELSGHEEL